MKSTRWFALMAIALAAAGTSSAQDLAIFFDGNAPLTQEALDAMRGGADVSTNDILASGQVGYNSAYNLTTGANFVTAGALEGASGFSTVVQNSGNNVLIQNSTIINLSVQ